MDDRGSERLRNLLSRLESVLGIILESPALRDDFRFELQSLYARVGELLQQSSLDPELVKVMWPEVENELSRFVYGSWISGLPAYQLRQAVDFLAGRSVAYFSTPPTDDNDLRNAVAKLVREANPAFSYLQRDASDGAGGAIPCSPPIAAYEEYPSPPEPPSPMDSRPKEPPRPPTRVVNTGFSERDIPDKGLSSALPLAPDRDYWFWLEIGELQSDSIEEVPTELPSSAREGAVLTIAVFSFPEELQLTEDADVGRVRLTGPIQADVVDQPGDVTYLFPNNPICQHRLLFPVRTPAMRGHYRLRCNIYCDHVLLQSRVVTAYVQQVPERGRALRSVLDYKLSHTLDPALLGRLGPQKLSLFINENSDGTHGFLFEGELGFKNQATIDAPALQDTLTQARKDLRRVAWGTGEPWKPSFSYRYASAGEPPYFASDLITLAIRGYLVYNALIDKLSHGPKASDELASLMLKPGKVQISCKESARFVVPAALFYDQPLDTQAKQHIVCDEFLKTLRAQQSLLDSSCFNGGCPYLNRLDVVCPGGFWGYRHELGLPVSIEHAGAGDADAEIQFNDPAAIVIVVSLDPMFKERGPHEARLKSLRSPLDFTLCDKRVQALEALQNQGTDIIYFYCHGGITENNTPFLNIGENENFTPDNIRAYRIRWNSPRPLVFLNGCMTTALEPEKALDFVSMFVSYAGASGVIGTEITVFEPLATKFAEAFLNHFMGKCRTIGESIKLARLTLLQQYNPLGLVYIPYALPGLHLVDLSQPQPTHSSGQT